MKEDFVGRLLSFIIFPFITFIYSFRTLYLKSSQLIFFLWGLLFAWSMHYVNFANGIDMIEIIRYFYSEPQIHFSDVFDAYSNTFDDHGDIRSYNLVVFWLTRLFSNNYHFMFLVASVPFMFFMVKSVSELLKNFHSYKVILVVLVILFIMPKNFFAIQNFRFATASWLAIYSSIQFFHYKRYFYIFGILSCIFIHTSFVFYLIIFVLTVVCSKAVNLSLLFKFYYLSIPFAFISADLFSELNYSILPPVFQRWIASYLSKDSFEIYGNMSYLKGSGFFFVTAIFTLLKNILYIYLPIKMLSISSKNNLELNKSFLFYHFLIFFTICNIVQCIPSLGSRYFDLVRILAVFLWAKYIPLNYHNNKFILLLFSVCSYELVTVILPQIFMVQDIDFFFNNLISLIVKFIGINSLV